MAIQKKRKNVEIAEFGLKSGDFVRWASFAGEEVRGHEIREMHEEIALRRGSALLKSSRRHRRRSFLLEGFVVRAAGPFLSPFNLPPGATHYGCRDADSSPVLAARHRIRHPGIARRHGKAREFL